MIKIAHRGNFEGKNAERENTMDYLMIALRAGYEVEVDVWVDIGGYFWVGHDGPAERVDIEFLRRDDVWSHAKDLATLRRLWPEPEVNCFWHDRDEFTFTSKGIKWANFRVPTFDGIMVMPDAHRETMLNIIERRYRPLGICCDDFKEFNAAGF
jgi:hypothetical protein